MVRTRVVGERDLVDDADLARVGVAAVGELGLDLLAEVLGDVERLVGVVGVVVVGHQRPSAGARAPVAARTSPR